MQAGDNHYLGKEKISKLLLKFAIPCILALLVSSLYNIVDQIFIGNSKLGYFGNAATSVVFPVTVLAYAFCGMLGDGAAAYLSLCQGRQDTKNIHKAIGNSILTALIISLVFVAAGYLFTDDILKIFGASETSLGLAREYLLIVLAFIPAYMIGAMLNGIIRADGSPKFAMVATLSGAIINMILDPVFIFGFDWGMQGAAWATAIGQLATLTVVLIYLTRSKTFQLKLRSFRFEAGLLKNVLKLGISSLITSLAIVVISTASNIMLTKYGGASKYGADIPLAAFGVCMKVFSIVINIAMGIIIGAQPILGYNIGSGRTDRVRQTFRLCISATLVVGVIATIIFEFFPELPISLFGVESELYLEFAVKTFRIFLMLMAFTCVIKVISVFFQAVGEPLKATVASLLRDIACFVPLVLILPTFMGVDGILWAAPIADVIGLTVAASMTFLFFRKLGREQSMAGTAEKGEIQNSVKGMIVTISREHGSKGKKIGELVARELKIPYYYKETTAIAAKESGLDAEYINKVDGDEPLTELYLTTSPAQYAIEAQEKALKYLADQGSCVIVGRAADYVLRERPNLLRVFVYAPKDLRIENVEEMYGDTQEEAIKHIKRSDKNRSEYYEMISGQKWGSPANYDLCINSSIGVEGAANLIANVVQGRKGK